MKINYCDALVIGGGLAGLELLLLHKKGLNTIVLSLVPVKKDLTLLLLKVVCKHL